MVSPAIVLAALLVSTTVSLQVDRVRGVDETTSDAIVDTITTSLQDGGYTVLSEAPRELPSAVPRKNPDQSLVVSVFGGPTTIRILAEATGVGRRGPKRIEEDYSLEAWRSALRNSMSQLFPPLSPAVGSAHALPGKAEGPSLLPWAAVGAGLVSIGVGTGFAISASNQRSDVASDQSYDRAGALALDDANASANLSAVFLASGAAVIAIGVAYAVLVEG